MQKEMLIKKLLITLKSLPEEEIEKLQDFAGYLFLKHQDNNLQHGRQKLAENAESYKFLNEEEELYSTKDLKEKLIQRIRTNSDEQLLQEIYQYLDEQEKAPIQFSEEESSIIHESLKEYEDGKITSHEKVEKRMDEWLKE